LREHALDTSVSLSRVRSARSRAAGLDPLRSGLEAVALFVLIQTVLLLRAQALALSSLTGSVGPVLGARMVGSIWPDQVAGLVRFGAVAVSGVVLARSGRRRLWAVPALAWFAMSFFGGGGHVPYPTPLGQGWIPPTGTPLGSAAWWAQSWAGALVDYGLAMLPAAVIAARIDPRVPPEAEPTRARFVRLTPEAAVALALCGYLLWLAITGSTEAANPTQSWATAPGLLPPFLFGLVLGIRRPGFLWAALVVPLLMAVNSYTFVPLDLRGSVAAVLATFPFVAACTVGVAHAPFTRAFERLRDEPVQALVLLNVLNVGDAVLTWIAVRSHLAVEANPVVRSLGLPAKVFLVALIGLTLYRLRPRAIVWAVAIMVGVIAWHIAGMFLTATV